VAFPLPQQRLCGDTEKQRLVAGMVKKVRRKVAGGAAGGEAQAEKSRDLEDLLDGDDGEDLLPQGLSGSEDDEDVDGDAEGEEEEGDDDAGDEPVDEDAAAEGTPESRLLALASGSAKGDLAALKQRIQDDATLLSNWRKSKQLGHGRQRDEVFKTLAGNCAIYFSYSKELAEYFLQMFSAEQAIKFFEANDEHRPLTIRTNSLKTRRSTLITSLNARRAHVDPVGTWTKVGLKVYDTQVPIGATPEYLGGHYMIQSASSFVPVMALAPQQNEVVLDMAAAPGGKTTYIGQLMHNTGTLFSNDLKKERCKSLVANIHRMGLTNVVVTNLDGKKLSGMLPKLDRVLLDAPCSGSGIIARDPSIKVKRGSKDFEDTSRLQKELLATAIDLVDANSKTGGYIVYSTCSVSIEENESVVEHALQTRNVELVSFTSSVNFGVEGFTKYRERRFSPSMNLCRRYYPHIHNMDGFFVAKFKKTSNEIPKRIQKSRWHGADHIKVWGEEHWTPEMMESVVDFTPDEKASGKHAGSASSAKPMNKKDRKKIKRQEKLRLKAQAEVATKASPKASPGEPEEEPKPSVEKLKKRRKVEAETPADAEAQVSETPVPASRKLKRKKAVAVDTSPGEAEVAEASAAPARKLKRKKVVADAIPVEAEVSATPLKKKKRKLTP
jgi:ribosomal RNA methyltransferase Nop2